jgi:hypothetical protein
VFPLIVPGEDNNLKVKILGVVRGIDLNFIKESIKESEQKLENEKDLLEKEFEQVIKEKGISGSAVMPNINVYSMFNQFQSDLKKEFQEKLLTISLDKGAGEDMKGG